MFTYVVGLDFNTIKEFIIQLALLLLLIIELAKFIRHVLKK